MTRETALLVIEKTKSKIYASTGDDFSHLAPLELAGRLAVGLALCSAMEDDEANKAELKELSLQMSDVVKALEVPEKGEDGE